MKMKNNSKNFIYNGDILAFFEEVMLIGQRVKYAAKYQY